MFVFDLLAEQRIQNALAQGEFANLPGAGRPLPAEDLSLVPEELRVGYRLLKNAGYLPPEVEDRKEAASLRAMLAGMEDEQQRSKALIRLQLLNLRMAAQGHVALESTGAYADALLERFGGER